jgi:hypothetical protein
MAPPEKLLGEMTGFATTPVELSEQSLLTQDYYMPFKWWFCRFYEQALPMISLHFHTVELEITTRALADLWTYSANPPPAVTVPSELGAINVIGNFVFLDNMERAMFANGVHEYVIDQTQITGPEPHTTTQASFSYELPFNHPVKEIWWVCQQTAHINNHDWFNFAGVQDSSVPTVALFDTDPFSTAVIRFNNEDRTEILPAKFFRTVVPYERHSRLPHLWCYDYSFALYPESQHPSGAANFSRFDRATIRLTFPQTGPVSGRNLTWDGQFTCYARNSNVFKIVAGMGGLRFAS